MTPEATIKYVELFAGAGGLSMGLEAAGMVPVAHAEIEPHARAVLRHHWPDTPLHGDVTQVDWTQYAGQVGLVAGGSPCQDLSVAGKRAGLAGARSGLFYQLIRAWDETGATYCLWENVDGARSSNKGEDLASVLSAFVGGSVAVPRDGWRRAGVVAGATGVAAWRVLDLQHFGPPQRRRRIFVLAVRAGGVDPAEILLESQGGCGHPSPREQQRQGAARSAAGGAGGGGIIPIGEVTARQGQARGSSAMIGAPGEEMYTLTSKQHGVFAWDNELNASCETHGPLMARAKSGGDRNGVLAFKSGQSEAAGGTFVTEGFTPTLQGGSNGSTQVPAVLALGGEVLPPLVARHSRGHAQSNSPSHTTDGQTVVQPSVLETHQDVIPTLGACNFKPTKSTSGAQADLTIVQPAVLAHGQANAESAVGIVPTLTQLHEAPIAFVARPRRLTPLECERLMGWPDQHTAHGVKEDGTAYALSDTARYRLCGNGVGTPVAAWIASRLMAEEAA